MPPSPPAPLPVSLVPRSGEGSLIATNTDFAKRTHYVGASDGDSGGESPFAPVPWPDRQVSLYDDVPASEGTIAACGTKTKARN